MTEYLKAGKHVAWIVGAMAAAVGGNTRTLVNIELRLSNIEARFNELAQKWYNECAFMSFLDAKFAHPAYRAIIDMGSDVVPYVLREIDRTHGHWGCALMELTGANPMRKADAGYVDRIAKAWVRWGKSNGYSW